jgi:N-acetyl-anhydromuramyl-L-alanine amidase AmpD
MKKWHKLLFLALSLLWLGGCSDEKAVVAKGEVEIEKQEVIQTRVAIPVNYDFMQKFDFEQRKENKTHVVLHFISNAAMNPENPYIYEDIRKIFVEYEVGSHYLIDRTGEIYFLLPENRVARHSGKGNLRGFTEYKDHLNDYSIGIELMAIGTEAEMESMMTPEEYKKIPPEHIGYTDAQYQSLNRLLDDILARNKKIKRDRNHIIGHDEYAPERKTDPGSLFDWSKIIN